MPELSTPLTGQIRVLEFGPRSVTPPPPLPPNTAALAKAQVIGTLAQALGDLPGKILGNIQTGKKMGLQNDAIEALQGKLNSGDLAGMKVDANGNVSYAPLDPDATELTKARIETQKALADKYRQPPAARAGATPKPTLHDKIGAEFGVPMSPTSSVEPALPELGNVDPTIGEAADDETEEELAGINELVPDIAPTEGGNPLLLPAEMRPEVSPASATTPPLPVAGAGSALADVDPSIVLTGGKPTPAVPVAPTAPVAAPATPAAKATAPAGDGIPTGPNIKRKGNMWTDISVPEHLRTYSMRREDGAIFDLLAGTNRWVLRKPDTKDAAATLKPGETTKQKVTSVMDAIKGVEELIVKRKETPEASALEKAAIVKQGEESSGFLDSLVRQATQMFVSKDAMQFEAARNRVNSLILFASGGKALSKQEKKLLSVIEPDDDKETAITKMETALPIFKRELQTTVEQYPGYFPDAERFLKGQNAPAEEKTAAPGEKPADAPKGTGTRNDPYKIDSAEAYAALKSGEFFIDSSGKLKKKP